MSFDYYSQAHLSLEQEVQVWVEKACGAEYIKTGVQDLHDEWIRARFRKARGAFRSERRNPDALVGNEHETLYCEMKGKPKRIDGLNNKMFVPVEQYMQNLSKSTAGTPVLYITKFQHPDPELGFFALESLAPSEVTIQPRSKLDANVVSQINKLWPGLTVRSQDTSGSGQPFFGFSIERIQRYGFSWRIFLWDVFKLGRYWKIGLNNDDGVWGDEFGWIQNERGSVLTYDEIKAARATAEKRCSW